MNPSLRRPGRAASKASLTIWGSCVAIGLSAFLLFQIQPIISRYILPIFGGGHAVWTAALLFFQLVLLLGYAYAHLINQYALSAQGRIHLGITLGVAAWLVVAAIRRDTPVTPAFSVRWDISGQPIFSVLLLLSSAIGLPFFLLSTTSSLFQSWYHRIHQGGKVYRFYQVSNLASLIALLTYPAIFEPNWTIKQQASVWTFGFLMFLLLVLTFSIRNSLQYSLIQPNSPLGRTLTGRKAGSHSAVPIRRRASWLGFATLGSVMLYASSNQLSQDIAPIPLLWVIPLGLFLLSFIIAFTDHLPWLDRNLHLVTLLLLPFGLWNTFFGYGLSIFIQILINSAVLLATTLLIHRLLYTIRPDPKNLTLFYLYIAIGGVLGGLFVNLIAPAVFSGFWEYNLGLAASAIIVIFILVRQSRNPAWLRELIIAGCGVVILTAVIQPVTQGLQSFEMRRNFYGVSKITPSQGGVEGYDLQSGSTIHGSQAAARELSSEPTRYYSRSSGIGQAIEAFPGRDEGKALRMGVIGLGVGTLASYGRDGDVVRFYEIDPTVINFARDSQYFSYLQNSPAAIEVIPGDARLSLEQELGKQDQRYDILVVDAFSSDSIPYHLVSEEAIRLYLQCITPDGLLAFNISNRHVDLSPVFAQAADRFHLSGRLAVQDHPVEPLSSRSRWVLLTPDPDIFLTMDAGGEWRPLSKKAGVRPWTDDYSNIFHVLR